MTLAGRAEVTKLWSQSWAAGFPGWDGSVGATGLKTDQAWEVGAITSSAHWDC